MKAPLRLLAALLALAAALTWISSAGAATTTRFGQKAPVPHGAKVLGALNPSHQVHITVALQPRDPAALGAFADAVSTPGNPDYHQFVSVPDFARRFGATTASQDAVLRSLRSHGLDAEQVSANGLEIQVAGTAAAVQKAFAISLQSYDVDGQQRYAADAAPALDTAITADVQSVSGLSTLAVPKPQDVVPPTVPTGGPEATLNANGCPAGVGGGALWPAQLATQYNLSGFYHSGDTGVGQTIGLVEYEPYKLSDIQTYGGCLGMSSTTVANHVSTVSIDGGQTPAYGSGESELDIEDVLGLAPGANVQVYVEGGSNDYSDLDMWTAMTTHSPLPQVISSSWGLCEQVQDPNDESAENTLFEEAAVQGQTAFSAAGDDGASDCIQSNNKTVAAVDDPASQPFVTGVGGTFMTNAGPSSLENAWNSGSGAYASGTGGGYSTFWQQPSWQSGAAAALGVPASSNCPTSWTLKAGLPSGDGSSTGGCREVPDIAADADPYSPYIVYYNGNGTNTTGWQGIGGTSAAAPLWGAFTALANDSSGSGCANGSGKLGFINPALYGTAGNSALYARDFNDVTLGNNIVHGVGYSAKGGYDLTTGLGTLNGTFLAGTLCGDSVSLNGIPNQSSTVNQGVSLTATVSAGSGVTYTAYNLPAGVTLSTAGTFSGAPTTIGTSYPTVVAKASNGQTNAQTFTWTVAQNKVTMTSTQIPAQSWTETLAIAPLTLTASDTAAGTITFSATGLPSGLTINPSSGVVSGTPAGPGMGKAILTATSSNTGSTPAQQSFNWTASPTTVSVSPVGDQSWSTASAVSTQVNASDSVSGTALSYAASGLPAGLSISPTTGLISGTPSAAQAAAPVTVTVTDANGSSATTSFNATVTTPAPPSDNGGGSNGSSSSNGSSGSSSSSGTGSTGSGSGASSSTGSGSTGSSGTSTSSSSTKPPPVPSSSGSASGATTKHPKFVVKVKAASGSRLSTVVIHLPSGFAASRAAKNIKAGIKVSVKGVKIKVSGSTITLTKLKGTSVTVTVSAPELTIAKSLATKIKKHKAKAESFTVTVNGHALKGSVKPS